MFRVSKLKLILNRNQTNLLLIIFRPIWGALVMLGGVISLGLIICTIKRRYEPQSQWPSANEPLPTPIGRLETEEVQNLAGFFTNIHCTELCRFI